MPRNRAQSFMTPAILGRISLTWMPGTVVGIALKALDLLSGLWSKVSTWLGPPVMNRRMQLLCFGLPPGDCSAARAPNVLSQPEAGRVRAPAAERFSHSRRERGSHEQTTQRTP